MQTVADFKRLIVRGLRLELVSYVVNMTPKPHPGIGKLRCVVHTQGDSFCLADDMDAPRSAWSWAAWPKRDELTWGDRTFTLEKGASKLTYKILPDPSNA